MADVVDRLSAEFEAAETLAVYVPVDTAVGVGSHPYVWGSGQASAVFASEQRPLIRQQWAQLAGVVLLVGALVIVSVSVGVPGVSRLRDDFAQFGVWAGVVYAGLYAAVSLAPLPAAAFTLAAGALFSVAEGLIVVEAGATVGAVMGFWLARLLGRNFVARVSGARVEKLDERFGRGGVLAVLAVRLLPVLPFAAVNYVSGLSSIRFRDYLLGTVVGILPAATAYVVLGAYGSRPGSVPFLAALGGLLVLVIVGLVSGQRNRRRRAASASPVSATPAADESGPTAS